MRRPDHHSEIVPCALIQGQVEGRGDGRVQGAFAQVFDDADDLHGHGWIGKIGDMLPERLFAREILADHRLVHDDHLRTLRAIRFREVAPAHQLGAHRSEVAAAHVPLRRLVVLSVPGTPQDTEPGGIAVATEGKAVGHEAYGLHAGQGFRARLDLPRQLDRLLLLAEIGIGSGDLQGDERAGLKSEVHLEEPVEALAQKSRAHQQHHGHGQLDDHEPRAEASPDRARRAAASFGEPVANCGRREA